jgi:hypothetical protein
MGTPIIIHLQVIAPPTVVQNQHYYNPTIRNRTSYSYSRKST